MDEIFEHAIIHAMNYEVGAFFQLTPEVEAGLIETKAQRRAVGYTIDPTDRGGETKFGVAQNANPDIDVTTLTWEEAKSVYYDRYWIAGKCHLLPNKLAILHFDGCVNHGIGRASKFLQKSVDTTPDGQIGDDTLQAVEYFEEMHICNSICDLREKFYRDIVASKPNQVKYLNGWLRRITEMRDYVTSLEL